MRRVLYYFMFTFIGFVVLNSCCFDCDGDYLSHQSDIDCKKYKYITFDKLKESVSIDESRQIDKAGKIYLYGDILLINEANKGIHIIDNSDKKDPINKVFITLWGNLDVAVKDGYLYADSFSDLLVFDIRDIDNIKKITKKENIFPKDSYQVIANNDHDFWYSPKCGFDSEKGIVVEVLK